MEEKERKSREGMIGPGDVEYDEEGFVRTAVTIDMTEEDIIKGLGLNRRKP